MGWTDAPGTTHGDGLDVELRPRGLGFGLTATYRINLTPTTLE